MPEIIQVKVLDHLGFENTNIGQNVREKRPVNESLL